MKGGSHDDGQLQAQSKGVQMVYTCLTFVCMPVCRRVGLVNDLIANKSGSCELLLRERESASRIRDSTLFGRMEYGNLGKSPGDPHDTCAIHDPGTHTVHGHALLINSMNNTLNGLLNGFSFSFFYFSPLPPNLLV